LFYQAVNVVLEMELDEDLHLADYEANFRRMFGNERMDAAIGSVRRQRALLRPDADQHETRRPRPPLASDRKL
jgi:hypothetical protein